MCSVKLDTSIVWSDVKKGINFWFATRGKRNMPGTKRV